MKKLFWSGIVLLVLGVASLLFPIPHTEREGVLPVVLLQRRSGLSKHESSIGRTTELDDRLWGEKLHLTSRQLDVNQKRETMKAATLVGILLIVLGIAGFAMGGISFTHQKKDVDMGPVQISHEKKDTLPLSPILSTFALVGGIALVVVGSRSK